MHSDVSSPDETRQDSKYPQVGPAYVLYIGLEVGLIYVSFFQFSILGPVKSSKSYTRTVYQVTSKTCTAYQVATGPPKYLKY